MTTPKWVTEFPFHVCVEHPVHDFKIGPWLMTRFRDLTAGGIKKQKMAPIIKMCGPITIHGWFVKGVIQSEDPDNPIEWYDINHIMEQANDGY